jgi:predicted GIY-YIG superfamily endonuclease
MRALTGTVYLLHFAEPYKHAAHYLGFTTDLVGRLTDHAAGQGARLTRVVKDAGINWTLTRVWADATRTDERRLKNRHGAGRFCPACGARPRTPAISDAVRADLPEWVFTQTSQGPEFSLTRVCVRCTQERGALWGERWRDGWVCFGCIEGPETAAWLDAMGLPTAEVKARYAAAGVAA